MKWNKHVLSPADIILRWIRVNNNSNYVTSEHNEQWNDGPFWIRRHTEALQRRSRLTTVSVFIPPKNHDYFFEFHPIKTALRPQGTAPILRVRFPFQDLWRSFWSSSHQMQHGAITLAPQKKEIIIILLICLRYDERRKAEDWIRWCRSCSFPGTNPHTVIWSCQTSLVHCNVCLPCHLFF